MWGLMGEKHAISLGDGSLRKKRKLTWEYPVKYTELKSNKKGSGKGFVNTTKRKCAEQNPVHKPKGNAPAAKIKGSLCVR